MDRTKFDQVCQELQIPEVLADHIWRAHRPPDNVTDDELYIVIVDHALRHIRAFAAELNDAEHAPGKPDGLAA